MMTLGQFNVRYVHVREQSTPTNKMDAQPIQRYKGSICEVYLGGILIGRGECTLSPDDNFSRLVGRYLTTKRAADYIRESNPKMAKALMEAFIREEGAKKNGQGIQYLRIQLKERGLLSKEESNPT